MPSDMNPWKTWKLNLWNEYSGLYYVAVCAIVDVTEHSVAQVKVGFVQQSISSTDGTCVHLS